MVLRPEECTADFQVMGQQEDGRLAVGKSVDSFQIIRDHEQITVIGGVRIIEFYEIAIRIGIEDGGVFGSILRIELLTALRQPAGAIAPPFYRAPHIVTEMIDEVVLADFRNPSDEGLAGLGVYGQPGVAGQEEG